MTSDLETEALRIYRRYQLEIVEGLRLCPWAERSRTSGGVRELVLLAPTPGVGDTLEALDRLAADDAVEIGLLIMPRSARTRQEHEWFVSELVRQDAARHELGRAPFAMAAFHPDAAADVRDPERLVPFIRRSPDPTIQLVRTAALDRVREGTSEGTQFLDLSALATLDLALEVTAPLRERIARANHRTITRLGVDTVDAQLAAIIADRDASYSLLDPSVPRWSR